MAIFSLNTLEKEKMIIKKGYPSWDFKILIFGKSSKLANLLDRNTTPNKCKRR